MTTYLSPTLQFKNASTEERLGIIGLLILALFAWSSPAGAYFGLAILLFSSLALLHQASYRESLFNKAMLPAYILLAFILTWPLISSDTPKEPAPSLTKEWGFLLLPWCGYYFYRFPRLVPICLLLLTLGLIIQTFDTIKPTWESVVHFFQKNPAYFQTRGHGLYFTLCLTGLIILFPRFLRWSKTKILRWIYITTYLLAIIWLLQCLINAQTRMAWICFAIAIVCLMFFLFFVAFRKKQNRLKAFMSLAIIFFIITPFIHFYAEKIEKNMALPTDVRFVQSFLKGDPAIQKSGSFSIRYNLNLIGIEQWQRAPFLGLIGPSSSKPLISKYQGENKKSQPHLHNAYLEVLVQLGVVGLALCIAGVLLTFSYATKCYKQQKLDGDLLLLFCFALAIIALWSTTNYRLTHADWRFFWIIFMGILQAQVLKYYFYSRSYRQDITSQRENTAACPK